MPRILLITTGLFFDPTGIVPREQYRWLSKRYCGVILSVAHSKELRRVKLDDFDVYGMYLQNFTLFTKSPRLVQSLCYAVFVLFKSMRLHLFRGRFDVIIVRDAFKTGLLGWVISKLTGARLIVEIIGNHDKAFLVSAPTATRLEKIKHAVAEWISPFVLKRAHGIKLLYPSQMSHIHDIPESVPRYVFHDFVPTTLFREGNSEKFIFFIGYPWFLKGVDILIKAFKNISADYPEYRLKIVGYCADRTSYEQLAAGNTQIEFHGPVSYHDVITLMAECTLFVLPSRTEAMGKVILEAMASKKPVIGSRVDGIPTYLTDGDTGLLFEPENVNDLEEKMRLILHDERYARRLANNAYQHVQQHLSEEVYLREFSQMIDNVLRQKESTKHGE